MDEATQRLIADFGCIDPVYVDGVAGTLNLGANFAMLFFRWQPVFRENAMVYDRVPAINLIRPKASIMGCKDCVFHQMLELEPPLGLAKRLATSGEMH